MHHSRFLSQLSQPETLPASRTGTERGLQAAASSLRQAWQGWTGAFARFCGVNAALLSAGSRRREEADSGGRDGFRLLTSAATRGVGLALLLGAGLVGRPAAWAQAGPQDNWGYEGKRLLGDFRGICVGRDDLVYVGVPGSNAVVVLDRNLNYVRSLNGTFGTICGMACDSQTNIYILEPSQIRKFNSQGNQLQVWGAAGSADGQFTAATTVFWNLNQGSIPNLSALAIDFNDFIYVADGANSRIQKFTTDGTLVSKWGQSGNLPGQFPGVLTTVAALNSDRILTWSGNFFSSASAFQIFRSDGTLLQRGTDVREGLTSTPEGLLLSHDQAESIGVLDANGALLARYYVFKVNSSSSQGGQVPTLGVPGSGFGPSAGIASDRYGRIYLALKGSGGSQLYVFERKYSADRPLVANTVPLPVLVNSVQRLGTTLIDIDFKVIDADSTSVSVGMLGFVDRITSLGHLVLMTNFIGSTAGKLGTNVLANQTHRVTWNTATDWNVGIGNIQFEVLAKDERGLKPFRFISVPTNAANPTVFSISDAPLTNESDIWYYLLATGDPRIRLVNTNLAAGVVSSYPVVRCIVGVGGTNDGRIFSFTSGFFANLNTDPIMMVPDITLPDGRAFLLGLLGGRNPTPDEVTRANAGRYGFPATVTTNHIVKLP